MSDAERLFSASLCQWFKTKGYKEVAEYIEVVNNWHRAGDERGLTDSERNYELLNFIHATYDLSLLEVNRLVNIIFLYNIIIHLLPY